MTFHYTASPPGLSVATIAAAQLNRQADADGTLFPAIAYTLVIPADGSVCLCHDLETRCWHSGAVINGVSRNRSHVGICYIGDVEPNEAQLAGLASAWRWVMGELGRDLPAEGHRDAPYPTSCPGPEWPHWLSAVTAHLG